MSRPKNKLLKVIYIIAFIIADLFVFWFLSVWFMIYTDFYDESEGPWMSLQSMTTKEKIIYFAIDLWYIANILLITWLTYKAFKWFRQNRLTKTYSQQRLRHGTLRKQILKHTQRPQPAHREKFLINLLSCIVSKGTMQKLECVSSPAGDDTKQHIIPSTHFSTPSPPPHQSHY
jgi:hypothetical protein